MKYVVALVPLATTLACRTPPAASRAQQPAALSAPPPPTSAPARAAATRFPEPLAVCPAAPPEVPPLTSYYSFETSHPYWVEMTHSGAEWLPAHDIDTPHHHEARLDLDDLGDPASLRARAGRRLRFTLQLTRSVVERIARHDGWRSTFHTSVLSICELPPGQPTPAASPVQQACTRLIADAEANTNQSNLGGYFYSFVDRSGSRIWPVSGSDGGVFEMSEGGANGTRYAAHLTGQLASGDVRYAGMGVNFIDPKGPFDARAYSGVAFYARRAPDSSAHLRLGVPDLRTDPDGRTCSECFNDFGVELSLSAQWQRYVIPFASLKQQPGWGAPRPSQIDQSGLFSLQFRATEAGAFDFWIDELVFLAC